MAKMDSGTVQVVSKSNKGVMINDQWYNSKAPAFSGLSKGSVVTFDYDVGQQGGNFLNGSITVVSSGNAGASNAGGKRAYSGSKSTAYEVGAAVGMAVNNGVLLSIAEGKGFDESFIKNAAVKVYTLAEDMKEKAADGYFKKKEEVKEEDVIAETGEESPDPF